MTGPQYSVKQSEVTPELLAELREVAEAATPGPWVWHGQRKLEYMLATARWGKRFIMGFTRMGMSGAQPMFQEYTDRTPPDDPFYWRGNGMRTATEIAVLQVPYREDIVALDNPDARYIARIDPTTVLALLDRITEIEETLDGYCDFECDACLAEEQRRREDV